MDLPGHVVTTLMTQRVRIMRSDCAAQVQDVRGQMLDRISRYRQLLNYVRPKLDKQDRRARLARHDNEAAAMTDQTH